MSIFRYPGSKSKYISKIIEPSIKQIEKTDIFHDVFVGGGSSFLYINECFPNKTIILNDLNKNIYNFWNCIKEQNLDFIIKESFKEITVERFLELRTKTNLTAEESAFNALFFNRTTFSGIDKAGPIGGYTQKGKYKINCRFNPVKITNEIINISKKIKGKIEVTNLSFQDYIDKYNDGFFYLDPPYYKEGAGLYSVSMEHKEHKLLFQKLQEKNNWILSYDNHPIILDWYKRYPILPINVKYSVSNNSNLTKEIAIYST